MLDYYDVQPDKIHLLTKHFTPGRGGAKPEYITRHHLAMIGEVERVVDEVWNEREASAHYVVGPKGRVGQAVYDGNTAWSNANLYSNQRSISIEHSNSGGAAAEWPISQETLISGARLAASLCLFYKLGRPVFGKNIRDHREFGQTSCPHHLANGGKYHKLWMDEAQRFYDLLAARKVTPTGVLITPEDKKNEETMMSDFDTRTKASDGTEHTYGDLMRYTDGRVFVMETETLPRLEAKLDKLTALLEKGAADAQ